MAKLDDASWHAGGDEFPHGLPEENAATHIGFFVTWLIRNDLWGDLLGSEAIVAIEAVRSGMMSGRKFLIEECDGKLITEMLRTEAIPFAEPYYEKQFIRDFQKTLAAGLDSDYLVEDNEANYGKLAAVISRRYDDWKSGSARPWWKFW